MATIEDFQQRHASAKQHQPTVGWVDSNIRSLKELGEKHSR